MSLALHNIKAGYGGSLVLKDITTEFQSGQFHALIGPNGSGKSTLLKTLAGIIKSQSGTLSGLSKGKPLSQQISYLSQTRTAHPQMSVYNVVALGRLPFRKPFRGLDAEDEKTIKSAIQQTDIHDLQTARFGTLSGGQQARVLLARALAVNAAILLVDEPVAALDPYYQLSILETLRQEAASGTTVIAALHDLSLVRQFSDNVYVLHQGDIHAQGPSQETLTTEVLESVFRIKEENVERPTFISV
jgi:iron complex transport system ATP-binding protein